MTNVGKSATKLRESRGSQGLGRGRSIARTHSGVVKYMVPHTSGVMECNDRDPKNQARRLLHLLWPDLEVGICGEHGGGPVSISFCHEPGLDYVSCSPYRAPVARLAAAQAALASSRTEDLLEQ